MKNFYFIGICGTAMGSLAVALKKAGYGVIGSDNNVYPPISTHLKNNQIKVLQDYKEKHILEHTEKIDCVIVGNAISRGNPEIEAVLNLGLPYKSLPEILKDKFLAGKKNFVVTGTHGKTTTSSILTWIFESSGYAPNYMIGGLPKNLPSGARFEKSDITILEGDEYDTAFFDKRSKFLHYLPNVLIINNLEFDHADIFASLDEIKLSFQRLINIVPSKGKIFINGDDPNCRELANCTHTPVISIGFAPENDVQITNPEYFPEHNYFTIFDTEFELPLAGEYNTRNAAMAITAAEFAGVPVNKIRTAIKEFKGVHKRQELFEEVNNIKIYDDFAHHPSAIRQSIKALRQKSKHGKIWTIIEPRSNTMRRNTFQMQLPDALGSADGVIIANLANIEKVEKNEQLDIDRLVEDLTKRGAEAFKAKDNKEAIEILKQHIKSGDSVITLSNGNFGNIHASIAEALQSLK